MDMIGRINPLLEALNSLPLRVTKIFVQKDTERKRVAEVIKMARSRSVPVVWVPKRRLDQMDKHHQGVVALSSPKAFTSMETILSDSKVPFLLLLDGVEDPQNLGAIIRTAEGAGVDGLILPERRSAGLSDVVSSVSAGALEHIKITRVKNLARSMDNLKEKGLWFVGAEEGSRNYWFEFDYTVPLGLVLGSEGKGLRPLVKQKCDKILSIPLLGEVTSLNVASAAAIFIYEVIRQRKKYLKT
ncbi:MAG: 23S rRNA (guanosine(2251)-2'-O)-methyltransferase RlmB [Candidatus Aminicenantes bacterium]|nr:23S rRNA (guanosine(2251)-2'-O)-methyltransferase RlmB [Candidatus Aminicenantes bacterium]